MTCEGYQLEMMIINNVLVCSPPAEEDDGKVSEGEAEQIPA